MKLISLIAAAFLRCTLLLLLGVVLLIPTPAQADIVTLTAADNGKQVQLNVGDQLIVRLPTISPRFGWRLTQTYPGQLTVTTTHSLPGLSSGVPGAPATFEIHFQAVGTGGLDLALISAQPGTGYSSLGGFFRVFVTIDKPGVAKNVNVTEYGNHSSVKVNKGDQLAIRLDNTAGSQYQWEVMPLADNVIQLIQPPTPQPAKKPKKKAKAGSEEDVTFQFQALNPGKTTLRFLYRNAANNEAPPKRDFELEVEVPEPPK
ncbi:protease inhibitor I42 family protein [Hymenobacter psychrotolerans]|uniref:Predicted secreted protein n=1 Tax=Hymenobacter psychrotolerans DSM 18569 TaxID=1121959 RepID=A0A1M7FXG1_9BACT|nr:protease inhibitor I42 family protein [Hymenobacter psychrotolerans]SHM08676.1 Predicted secreted protein [Hymenobacter psychrotolerans DSM 18569]